MSHEAALNTLTEAARASGDVGLPLPVDGLEAIVVGALAALPTGAWWVPGPREHAGASLRDVPTERLGPDGARPYKVAPVSTAPALRALHAVGLARASGGPALVHLGVGSVSDGAFTEALNLARLLDVQVLFLVAEHVLGPDAPLGPQTVAGAARLAEAHGVPVHAADGRDADGVQTAVQAALEAGGPAVITARL